MRDNINAGDLRHRVTLGRNSPVRNSIGQLAPNYSTVGTYYALVECLGGAEVDNATRRQGLLKWRVTLRASSGPINPTDRITWKSAVIEVESATPDPFGILIEVEGTSVLSQQ